MPYIFTIIRNIKGNHCAHGHNPQPMQSIPAMDYLSIINQRTWPHLSDIIKGLLVCQSPTSVHGHTPQPMQSMPAMDYLSITNQCTWAHPSTNAVNASNGLPVNHQPEYMGTPLNQCQQWTTYQSLTSVHGHTPQPMQSMPAMDYLSITDQYTWAHPLSKDLSVNHHPVHMGTPSSRMYTWTYTLVLMVIIIAELHFMINHHSLHSP